MTRITSREQARGADAVVVLGGGVQTVKTSDVVLSQLGTIQQRHLNLLIERLG